MAKVKVANISFIEVPNIALPLEGCQTLKRQAHLGQGCVGWVAGWPGGAGDSKGTLSNHCKAMRCKEILLDLSFIDLLLSLYGFGCDTDKMLH